MEEGAGRKEGEGIALPVPAGGGQDLPHLDGLRQRARGYAASAKSHNTRKDYEADWRQFRHCPVRALQTWLRLARITDGPVFRPLSRRRQQVAVDRTSDKHVARLVKKAALAAGLCGDLPERMRALRFAGHSLRAGLATAVEADESAVQKHLGHAAPVMTRRYQRHRDRFRINLTRLAGL